MKHGYLSEYFSGIAAKRLSAVETDSLRSHQHEWNGISGLREILGSLKATYTAKLMYLNDSDDDPIIEQTTLSWYDAREKHPTRTEYRLYYPATASTLNNANVGDLLVIAKCQDQSLLVIVAENNSSIANQIEWLFGLSNLEHPGFAVRAGLETEQDRIAFASRFILETIGVESRISEENFLEDMLRRFDRSFPSTKIFSAYARSTLSDIDPNDDADHVLMAWMEREEVLFRTLERHLIADRLASGFSGTVASGLDVEGFISYSLSIQNRRKSRAGYALENHLESLFQSRGVQYTRNPTTENKAKPDFIFPNIKSYQDPHVPAVHLTMLGVKTTCKDRWRQIMSEADRISQKHLLSLEAAISQHQTNEMASRNVQLVLPQTLHSSYHSSQQKWLLNVKDLTNLLLKKQAARFHSFPPEK